METWQSHRQAGGDISRTCPCLWLFLKADVSLLAWPFVSLVREETCHFGKRSGAVRARNRKKEFGRFCVKRFFLFVFG